MKKGMHFRLMRRTTALVLTAALTLLLTSLSGCLPASSTSSKDSGDNPIIVGMELKYPPFETVDGNGNPAGISVDIATALGEYLGRPVRIENIAFDGLIASLQTKKIDLIISSMTIRDDRKETIDFSDPYTRINLALLIAKDSKVSGGAGLDSPDVTIAVKNGTSGYLFAKEKFPQATIRVFDETAACILEVSQGKCDAFIYDQMTIFEAGAANPDTCRTNLEPLSDTPESWGIGLRKGEEELLSDVNEFIRINKENGFFNQLGDQYLSKIKSEFDQRGIPFFFD